MTICASCDAVVMPGRIWCPSCRHHVVNPWAGRLASPVRRLFAFILDVLLPGLVVGIPTGIAGAIIDDLALLVFVAASAIYLALFLFLLANGTTPGKKLLGMRVIREDGRTAGLLVMIVREWIGKFISSVVLYLGFLWIIFDRDRQGWHDKVVDTYVVR